MQFLAVQAGIALWLMQLNINHTHCVSGEDQQDTYVDVQCPGSVAGLHSQ